MPFFGRADGSVSKERVMAQKTQRTMIGKKKSAARTMFRGTRGWIAAGTLAAYSVSGGTKAALAEKEKTDPAGPSSAEATLPLKKFEIAARR